MNRSTTHLMPELRYALYQDAMKILEKSMGKGCWSGGWPLIRGKGKQILGDDTASDSECADAIILRGVGLRGLVPKRKKQK